MVGFLVLNWPWVDILWRMVAVAVQGNLKRCGFPGIISKAKYGPKVMESR